MAFGFIKGSIQKARCQLFAQRIYNRVFRAEMIAVYKIYSKLLCQEKLMVFYIGSKICIAAFLKSGNYFITAGTAENGNALYAPSGIVISEPVGMKPVPAYFKEVL